MHENPQKSQRNEPPQQNAHSDRIPQDINLRGQQNPVIRKWGCQEDEQDVQVLG